MRCLAYLVILGASLVLFAAPTPAAAQVVDVGQEFVVFIDSTNTIIPDVEPTVVADPDDPGNPVVRMDYRPWASVAMAFDEAVGGDLSAMVSTDPASTTSLFVRLRIDSEFQGRGDCLDSGSSCLSISLFDSFSGPQDRESIHTGAGDAAMRLKWFVPDSLRDGQWHNLEIPLPPPTLASLEAARAAGTLSPAQTGWHYTGAWAGSYGIGCCGSLFETSQDSLWREFDWGRVARIGVQFDFNDTEEGSVYFDDWYFGTPGTDVSDWGLAQPVLPVALGPSDGEQDVPAATTLRWSGRAGAPHEVQVSRAEDFTTLDREATVATDSLLLEALTANATYYWRVRAVGRSTNSAWTPAWRFTVASVSVPLPEEPADGAIGVALTPSFSWEAVAGAISYRWQLATDQQFANPLLDEAGIPEPSFVSDQLDPGGAYHWRVRAESVQGAGDWSPASTFTTVEVSPEAPRALGPVPGSLDVSTDPVLSWGASARAATYELQLSTSTDFTAPLINTEVASTSYQVWGLSRGGTYSWRVRARNTGGTSPWATAQFQTEMDPPAQTRPSRPVDGAVETPLTLVLGWEAVPGAAHYRVQIAHSVSFDSPVVDTVSVGADSLQVGPLRPFRVHFWRVQAGNRAGISRWSDIHTFRTSLNQAPDAVEDRASGPEDVPLDVAVLSNDSDPDADPLRIISHTEPTNGYAYLASPGIIRYVPFQNWAGSDSLRYTADDRRGGTSEANVYVEITPVNDPPGAPSIVLPRAGSVLNVEGDPGRLLRVLWNPVDDVEGDSVTYRWEMAPTETFSTSITRPPVTPFQTEISFGELAGVLDSWGLSAGTVYHRVVASDGTAETPGDALTVPVLRGTITSIEDYGALPEQADIEAFYPNPAASVVNLTLALPASSQVSVTVSDALGRLVQTSSRLFEAGRSTLPIRTAELPAGVYLVAVEAAGRRFTRTVLVTR